MSMVEPGSDIQSTGAPPATNPKKKRNMYLLAGGGVLVAAVVYLYAKKKSAASSATTSTTAGTNSTTPTLVLPSSNQDATGSSDYAALSGQLGQLANQLSQQQSQPTTTTTATPTPTPAATTPTQTTPTGSYVPVTGGAGAVAGDIAQGQTLYQSGTEANAFDLQYGTPAGQTLASPGSYYGLSAAAAQGLAAAGSPVYVYNPNG